MAAVYHHVSLRSYNSPPPILNSDPCANECKLVEYRCQKVAAFIISGDTMLCLPQAFDIFLKHLVGGPHTVYAKLKRLEIVPLVCSVEQIRILRGLGAIQPGVNRCKLLSCKDFDVLYRDCTTARPGRPPKRGPVGLSLPPSHLSQHPQLKKHRLDNGDFAYENGHMNDMSRLVKSPLLENGYSLPLINHMAFMQMNQHLGSALMSPEMASYGLRRPDGPMMKAQSGTPSMDALARSGNWENCRATYEDIVKHLGRLRKEQIEDKPPVVNQKPKDLSSRNGSPGRQSPVLNLSKTGVDQGSNCDASDSCEVQSSSPSVRDEEHLIRDYLSDVADGINKEETDMSDVERDISQSSSVSVSSSGSEAHHRALNYSTLAVSAVAAASGGVPPGSESSYPQASISSTEILLRNIENLMKVAANNARQQECQINHEKAELKIHVVREREIKNSLEGQLAEEHNLRVLYQKRYRREKKLRIRLQQQLERKPIIHLDDQTKTPSHTDLLIITEENTIKGKQRKSVNYPSSSDHRCKGSESQSSFLSPERDRDSDHYTIIRDGEGHKEITNQIATAAPPKSSNIDSGGRPWKYQGVELISTGAIWQNYSAQEI